MAYDIGPWVSLVIISVIISERKGSHCSNPISYGVCVILYRLGGGKSRTEHAQNEKGGNVHTGI